MGRMRMEVLVGLLNKAVHVVEVALVVVIGEFAVLRSPRCWG